MHTATVTDRFGNYETVEVEARTMAEAVLLAVKAVGEYDGLPAKVVVRYGKRGNKHHFIVGLASVIDPITHDIVRAYTYEMTHRSGR